MLRSVTTNAVETHIILSYFMDDSTTFLDASRRRSEKIDALGAEASLPPAGNCGRMTGYCSIRHF